VLISIYCVTPFWAELCGFALFLQFELGYILGFTLDCCPFADFEASPLLSCCFLKPFQLYFLSALSLLQFFICGNQLSICKFAILFAHNLFLFAKFLDLFANAILLRFPN
jgi:hypothetical protein